VLSSSDQSYFRTRFSRSYLAVEMGAFKYAIPVLPHERDQFLFAEASYQIVGLSLCAV
jgi:hypothetical protein